MTEAPAPSMTVEDPPWKAVLGDETRATFGRGGYPAALMAAGWVHLGFFLVCQWLYDPAIESDVRFPIVWSLEILAVIATMRAAAGRGWWNRTPAASLVVRMWGTFLILSFNLATMNTLTGWELDWFKPVWATLSTFLFAMLAWLFDLRFLIFAVQMYFTGLLMVQLPAWNYLIYGVSWCAALQVLGWHLGRKA